MLKSKEGTYKYCSNCKMKKNCCCEFDKIDNIVTTIREKNEIIEKFGSSAEVFFRPINNDAYNIVSNQGVCPFYKNGCTIYEIRPSDCRLFPYDIKEIDNRYFLVKYDLSCGSKNVYEKVDKVIETLKPIINTYSNKKINEKVDRLSYTIIKEIN